MTGKRPHDLRDPSLREVLRCTARNGKGERCKLPAMLGSNVCRSHGRGAP
jgi:hypothetical protein